MITFPASRRLFRNTQKVYNNGINLRYAVAVGMAALAMGASAVTTPRGLVLRTKAPPTASIATGDGETYATVHVWHGSPVFRYQVENTSATPQVARVTLKKPVYHGRWFSLVSTVSVGAGEKKDLEPRFPFFPLRYGGLTLVEIDDGTGAMSVGDADGTVEMYIPYGWRHDKGTGFLDENYEPQIVVSAGVEHETICSAYSSVLSQGCAQKNKHGSCGRDAEVRVRTCDFSRFTDWRDFSVASAVVVDAKSWTNLTAAALDALKGYVVAGGSLVLLGEGFPKNAVTAGRHGLGEVVWFRALAPAAAEATRFAQLVADGARNFILAENAGTPRIPCGVASLAAVRREIDRTPVRTIVLVLLAFVVIAGPATVVVLAKTNRRIHLLWVFPSVSVLFSAVVVVALVTREGTELRTETFVHTAADAEFAKTVTVEDRVLVAPIALNEAIDLPGDALVTFDGGDDHVFGETVVVDEGGYHFRSGWTPPLWPVRFRVVRVEGGAK